MLLLFMLLLFVVRNSFLITSCITTDEPGAQKISLWLGRSCFALAMDDLVRLAEVTAGNVDVARALVGKGWSVTRLAALVGEEGHVLEELCDQLAVEVGRPVSVRDLQMMAITAEASARLIWKTEGRTFGAELLVASELKKAEEQLNAMRKIRQEAIAKVVPRKGTAAMVRWPTRLEKRLSAAGDKLELRQGADKSERHRWINELKHLLWEARLPALYRDLPLEHADESLRFGKGRRASTLRKHVKTWIKARDWMKKAFGYPWPRYPEEFALYLEARANEPCGRTVPGSIYKTFIFMEIAGEVEVEHQMSKAPAIRNVLEEIAIRLEGEAPRFTRKAWHLPVSAVSAMERSVMDGGLTRFVRAYSWFRLIKLWAGLRFSDTKGLAYSSLKMEEHGLSGVLSVTKTTGPGKKVSLLRIFINREAWLEDGRWLEEGWAIWEAISAEKGYKDRDFFLPMPTRDLEGIVRRMSNYYTAAQMSQALFGELDTKGGDREIKLLESGVGTLWTEHSERVTLRTWSAAAGVPDRVMKLLGRWSPTVDQGYERQNRRDVLKAQECVANFVKKSLGGHDPFDEALVMQAVAERMDYLGFNDEEIAEQIIKLRSFGRNKGTSGGKRSPVESVGGWEDPTDEEVENVDKGASELGQEEEEVAISDAEPDEAVQVPLGHYVISVVGRSKRKMLHRVGECFRKPGEHYSVFEWIGAEPPASDRFHRACMVCFPKGSGPVDLSDDSQSGEEEVTSSDSSSPEE